MSRSRMLFSRGACQQNLNRHILLPQLRRIYMKIASVDPGEVSGLAMYDRPNKSLTLFSGEPFEIIDRLMAFEPDTLLVEQMPTDISLLTMEVLRLYNELIDPYSCDGYPKITIYPGAWKPVAKAREWKCEKAKTPHERDAYNIMRYWFWNRKSGDIGDVSNTKWITLYDC